MDPMPVSPLLFVWRRDVGPFGADPTAIDDAFADLAARYREAGRYYHTLDHIAGVRQRVGSLRNTPPALKLAAWYHDAIYDTRAADNEERSAALARSVLPTVGVPPDVIDETARLILLTRTHQAAADDVSGQLLIDADLAVLSGISESYDRYAAAIRQEYAWVPEAEYRAGRLRVLEGFLARPKLFYLYKFEEPARANLRREIDQLRAK